jgi:polyferredoxin
MSTLAADAVLLVHFAFVSFVLGGFALIWLGALLHWQWIRNFRFRAIHLAAISFVAAEAVAGVMCPLTVWEDALRGSHTQTSFIARWVRRMLFYELPEWVFTAAYLSFAAMVALTLWLVPPKRRRRG